MASGYSAPHRSSRENNNKKQEPRRTSSTSKRTSHESPNSPRSPRLSRKSTNGNYGSPPSNGNRTRRNTGVPETTIPFPSLVYKGSPEHKPVWWHRFSIKITNLIKLLNSLEDKLNYVITGSSAVALLTFVYRPDLLNGLKAPNDCDILIKGLVKQNFNNLSIKQIGDYELPPEQFDTTSGTFTKKAASENTFPKIDISIETGKLEYVELPELPEFRILNPTELLKVYKGNLELRTENKKKNNEIKISVLQKIFDETKISLLKPKHFSKHINNGNGRRRAALGAPFVGRLNFDAQENN